MKALVVWHGHGNHPLDKLLKNGFKHCFVVVQAGDYWIQIDGRAGRPVVELLCYSSYDLETFYREQEGYTVVATEQSSQAPIWPFLTANCVGLVKGILCIGRPFLLTPWQLYRYLTRPDRSALLPGKSLVVPPKPKTVKPQAPVSVERDDPVVEDAGDDQRLAELRRRGRAATILTRRSGLSEEAPLGRPAAGAAQS